MCTTHKFLKDKPKHGSFSNRKGSKLVNWWILFPDYMHVNLTWTRIKFAYENRFRLLSLTFSDGIVAGFANHLPLLNPLATGHRTLPRIHTNTNTHTHTHVKATGNELTLFIRSQLDNHSQSQTYNNLITLHSSNFYDRICQRWQLPHEQSQLCPPNDNNPFVSFMIMLVFMLYQDMRIHSSKFLSSL